MAKQTVGVLGSGAVGQVLAAGFRKHGYAVTIGSRTPGKLGQWLEGAGAGVDSGSFADAAAADILVLAVGGAVATEALDLAGHDRLAGKVILDATNPIAPGPPVNGILEYFTGPNESLMERLQAHVPAARFVKAFSCVGSALMVNPAFQGGRATMFICGNDADAKAQAVTILDQFGWDAEDVGVVTGARAIEPLCQLWCAPGFLRNDWSHAYRVVRP
jgi:predicted dinucleotide-binding enzyme